MVKTLGSLAALALTVTALAGAPAPPASADEVTVTYDRLIAGPTNAKVDLPTAIDLAPDGRVVVGTAGNAVGGGDATVRIFSPSATGDVAPTAVIESPPVGFLDGVRGVAVGPDNRIHVGLLNDNSVRTFTSAGGVYGQTDVIGSAALIGGPVDIAAVSATQIWVVSIGTGEVILFTPGNSVRQRTLMTLDPKGVAVAGTSVYVSGGSPAGATAPYVKVYTGGADTPARTITGPATGLSSVGGLDIDSHGRIYVTDPLNGSIRVFAADANGNVAPIKALQLPAPSPYPVDVTLDSGDNVWLVNGNSAGSVGRIRALDAPPVTAPTKPRSLKVKGSPGARKRVVKWKAPASNGGAPVLRYQVVVKKGSKRLVKRVVPASRHRMVLKRSKLRSGVHTVRVRAINAKGASAYTVKRFRVRK